MVFNFGCTLLDDYNKYEIRWCLNKSTDYNKLVLEFSESATVSFLV